MDAAGTPDDGDEHPHDAEKDNTERSDHDENSAVGCHDILLATLTNTGGACENGGSIHKRAKGGIQTMILGAFFRMNQTV
jgi:hypothetical protein